MPLAMATRIWASELIPAMLADEEEHLPHAAVLQVDQPTEISAISPSRISGARTEHLSAQYFGVSNTVEYRPGHGCDSPLGADGSPLGP
ncbi:hypothetical protein BJF90_08975 [Pseudonocardia sp. CNS-004]|nr:hypothetical protein BJF90_08975 [Pseudonocardia sp. CNS-004]